MSREWEEEYWRMNGRTGSGAGAPQYAKRSDRNKVRRGKEADVGKPGVLGKLFGKKLKKK